MRKRSFNNIIEGRLFMKDPRDEEIEYRGGGMGNEAEAYYKGTNLRVPNQIERDGWTSYEGSGVCGLCGRYNCSGGCFK